MWSGTKALGRRHPERSISLTKRPLLPLILVSAVVIAAGCGWYCIAYPEQWSFLSSQVRALASISARQEEALVASGFFEVDQTNIAPEVNGQIVTLHVDEGDSVVVDQALVSLDRRLWDADVQAARAAVAMAEAQLAQVEAGARMEDIGVAEAGVHLAQAQALAAGDAMTDTLLLQEHQQELDMQILAAQNQVKLGQLAVQQSIPFKDAAELAEGLSHRQVDFVEKEHHKTVVIGNKRYTLEFTFDEGTKRQASAGWNRSGTQVWEAWVAIGQAQVGLENVQRSLSNLQALRAQPLALQLAVLQAQAAQQQAAAAVPVALANLDLVRAGATDEQIATAKAQVEQAQAALNTLLLEEDRFEIVSPLSGQVIDRPVNEGEVVLVGRTLITLADLDPVDLTVFVPEPDMGRVFVGQPVRVTVDAFPGQPFDGRVVYVAHEAEFTPKNIQTGEERASTVFAVKIEIPNAEHVLRPGMPADALFVE